MKESPAQDISSSSPFTIFSIASHYFQWSLQLVDAWRFQQRNCWVFHLFHHLTPYQAQTLEQHFPECAPSGSQETFNTMDKSIKKTGFLQEFSEPLMFTLSLEESRYNIFQFPNIFDHTFFLKVHHTGLVFQGSLLLFYIFSQIQIFSCLLSLFPNWSPFTPHKDVWNRLLNWSPCFQILLPPITLYVPDIHQGIICYISTANGADCLASQLQPSEPYSACCFSLGLVHSRHQDHVASILSSYFLQGQILKLLQAQPHILPPPWNLSWLLCSRKRRAIGGPRMSSHPSSINTNCEI